MVDKTLLTELHTIKEMLDGNVPLPATLTMNSIREQMKQHAASMRREEEFEVEGMPGVRVLAIGLMTGDKNRLLKDSTDHHGNADITKLSPRVLAMTIHDPVSREPLWNVNSLDDHNEINALPPVSTDHMQRIAFKVCGIGKEAEEEGKADSASETTNSNSSSQPVLAVA